MFYASCLHPDPTVQPKNDKNVPFTSWKTLSKSKIGKIINSLFAFSFLLRKHNPPKKGLTSSLKLRGKTFLDNSHFAHSCHLTEGHTFCGHHHIGPCVRDPQKVRWVYGLIAASHLEAKHPWFKRKADCIEEATETPNPKTQVHPLVPAAVIVIMSSCIKTHGLLDAESLLKVKAHTALIRQHSTVQCGKANLALFASTQRQQHWIVNIIALNKQRDKMESRLSARTLLCRLVLVACIAWTHSFPLPKNLKDELKKLKSTIVSTALFQSLYYIVYKLFIVRMQHQDGLWGWKDPGVYHGLATQVDVAVQQPVFRIHV